MLGQYEDKLFIIGDHHGNIDLHSLAPKIRFGWDLVKFQLKGNGEVKPVKSKKE